MTERPSNARTRANDRGFVTALRNWYDQWGALLQLVIGVALLVMAFFVAGLALELKRTSDTTNGIARNARATAHVSCVRSMQFGPALADFLELSVIPHTHRHVLSHVEATAYRASIPTNCK